MKIKELKPKYNMIELLAYGKEKGIYLSFVNTTIIGEIPFKVVKEKYGEREVISTKDFESTNTTSIIIEGERE